MVLTRRLRVVCVLLPGFHTIDVALFSAPLSIAGRRWNHKAFAIELCGPQTGPVTGSPHDLLATAVFGDTEAADVVFLPGGDFDLQQAPVTALERSLGQDTKLCVVGRGQLLAQRLLGNRIGTLLGNDSLRQECDVGVVIDDKQPWRSDGDAYLAARSLAAWDIALKLVEDTLGKSEAQFVAAEFGRPHRKVAVSIRK